LRILPVYFVYLATIYFLDPARENHGSGYLAALTFTSGTWDHSDPYVLAHFWSLAVEEQFYLLWPPLLTILPSKVRIAVLASLVALLPISRGISRRVFPDLDLIPLANAMDALA